MYENGKLNLIRFFYPNVKHKLSTHIHSKVYFKYFKLIINLSENLIVNFDSFSLSSVTLSDRREGSDSQVIHINRVSEAQFKQKFYENKSKLNDCI